MKCNLNSTRPSTTPDSLLGSSNRGRSMTKPDAARHQRLTCWLALIFMFGAVAIGPAMAIAQSTGSQPTFNATVQGQSASTVEGTFGNVVRSEERSVAKECR